MSVNEKDSQLIYKYIDGSLNKKEKCRFESRLKSLPVFARQYQEISTNLDICRNLPEQQLPSDFDQMLHLRLIAASEEIAATKIGRGFAFSGKWIGLASTVAACFFVALILRFTVFNAAAPFTDKNATDDSGSGLSAIAADKTASPQQDANNLTQSKSADSGDRIFAAGAIKIDARRVDMTLKIADITQTEKSILDHSKSFNYGNADITSPELQKSSEQKISVIEIKIPVSDYNSFAVWMANNFPSAAVTSDSGNGPAADAASETTEDGFVTVTITLQAE